MGPREYFKSFWTRPFGTQGYLGSGHLEPRAIWDSGPFGTWGIWDLGHLGPRGFGESVEPSEARNCHPLWVCTNQASEKLGLLLQCHADTRKYEEVMKFAGELDRMLCFLLARAPRQLTRVSGYYILQVNICLLYTSPSPRD